MKKFFDEEEIRKALSIFHPDGELFEVRILKERNGLQKIIYTGYFKSAESCLRELRSFTDWNRANVYFTLNELHEGCEARWQFENILQNEPTTSDNDVIRRKLFYIDLDVTRPAGISSTNEELTTALQRSNTIIHFLRMLGFGEPVICMSGNGCHLFYKIDLPNNEETNKLIDRCYTALKQKFSTAEVKIDTSVKNPARICKLHGTLAQKGRDTATRPHRIARVISDGDGQTVTREKLEELSSYAEAEDYP